MKKILIISSDENNETNSLLNRLNLHLTNITVDFVTLNSDSKNFKTKSEIINIIKSQNYELVVLYLCKIDLGENLSGKQNIIALHPSLLPAFDTDKAIENSFSYGVKVSGVTIFKPKKSGYSIIAQYPLLIETLTSFNEFKQHITELGNELLTVVIEKLLENKLFDFTDLINKGCNHKSCSGCGGCKH